MRQFLSHNLCLLDVIFLYSFAGRRVCLGEQLARMELFLYITSLVQRFEFLPAKDSVLPPIKGRLGVTHCPEDFDFRAIPRT